MCCIIHGSPAFLIVRCIRRIYCTFLGYCIHFSTASSPRCLNDSDSCKHQRNVWSPNSPYRSIVRFVANQRMAGIILQCPFYLICIVVIIIFRCTVDPVTNCWRLYTCLSKASYKSVYVIFYFNHFFVHNELNQMYRILNSQFCFRHCMIR